MIFSIEGFNLEGCVMLLGLYTCWWRGLSALVSGTTTKLVRTQTSHTQEVVTSPRKQHPLYTRAQENHYFCSPSRDVPAVSGPLEGLLFPTAVLLGRSAQPVKRCVKVNYCYFMEITAYIFSSQWFALARKICSCWEIYLGHQFKVFWFSLFLVLDFTVTGWLFA